MKMLAIQFRYLGDAALLTPALRAMREHFPDYALHVLVAEEVVPLLQHMPGVARVWAFPRRRGSAKPGLAWPVIRALRKERFDRSVDFGGNDRGAVVSRLCGARHRLGPLSPGGFLGRRFCYTMTRPLVKGPHQSLANFQLLEAWAFPPRPVPAWRSMPIPPWPKSPNNTCPARRFSATWPPASPRKSGPWRIGPSCIGAPLPPDWRWCSPPASPRVSKRSWRS